MLDSLKMREIKGVTFFKNIPGIKGMLSRYSR
jgi:ribosomal protein L30/L7E